MSRVERFTQRARQILGAAQEEAESSHSPSVETAHILLGILRITDSLACHVLNDLRINYDRVLPIVLSAHPGEPTPTKAVIAPETKRLLDSSTNIARERGDNYIGSEHFLLALVKGDDKSIRYLIRQLNIEPTVVRSCIERILQEHPDDLQETKPFQSSAEPADHQTMPLAAESNLRARVIKLVEDEKITAREAADLLKAMRLAAVPLDETSGYVLLPLDSVNFDELRQRNVHITLSDSTSNAITADITLPFEQAQNQFFRLLLDAYRGETGSRVDIDGAQGHMTISIE